MAVDRGGLDYTIRVRDQFRKELADFRNQTQLARREFRRLQRELRQAAAIKSTPEQRIQLAELRKQSTELRAIIAQEKTRGKQLDANVAKEKRLGQEAKLRTQQQQTEIANQRRLAQEARVRLEREKQVSAEVNKQVLAQRAALAANQRRVVQARRDLAQVAGPQQLAVAEQRTFQQALGADAARSRASAARDRLSAADIRERAAATRNLADANRRLAPAAADAGRGVRSLIFAIGGSIIIREALQLFENFVGSLVSFSANIEQARLGVASLITAVSEVRDAFGNVVEGPEALIQAQAIASDQLEKLRSDALNTAATFEQLAETFQVALAPGVQAGLGLDEIRQFTVRIAQAAAAIGLEQNQLAEEIRSILAGTISARQTRIATSLGITNEDIRNAREAGRLAEFLNERFAAFDVAASSALENFTVRLGNLRNAFQLVQEQGGAEFFQFLSDSLVRLQSLLISRNDITGALTPNPAAVQAIEAITDGLKEALEIVTDLGTELGFEGIQDIGEAIGRTIVNVTQILKGAVLGLVDAGGTLRAIFEGLRPIFESLGNLLGFDAGGGVEGVTRLVAQFGILSAVLGTVLTLLSPVVRLIGLLSAGLRGVAAVQLGGSLAQLSRLTSQLGLGARAAGALRAGLLGVGAVAVGALVNNLVEVTNALVDLNEAQKESRDIAAGREGGASSQLGALVVRLERLADSNLGDISDSAAEKLQGLRAVIASVNDEAKQENMQAYLRAVVAVGQSASNSAEQAAQLVTQFGASEEAVRSFLALQAGTNDARRAELLSSFEAALDRVSVSAASNAGTVRQFFDAIGGSANNAIEDIEGLEEVFEQLQESLRSAQNDIRVAEAGLLGGPAAAQLASQRIEIEETTKDQFDRIRQLLDEQRAQERNAAQRLSELAVSGTNRIRDAAAEIVAAGRAFDELSDIQGFEAEAAAAGDRDLPGLAGLSLDEQRQAQQLARDILAEETKITVAKDNQARLQERSNELRQRNLELLQDQSTRLGLQLQAETDPEITEAESALAIAQNQQGGLGSQAAIQTAQAELNLLRERQALSQRVREQELAALQQRKFVLQTVGASQESIDAIQGAINEKVRENVALRNQEKDAVNQLQEDLTLAQEAERAPIITGIKQAFVELEQELPTRFEATLMVMKDLVNNFSAFAADLIVDAFDPTTDVNLKERIARFLQGIAKQLIQLAIRAAIVRAISGSVGAPAAGGAGFHAGGEIPAGKGYASGGKIASHPFARPSGLHPSDTVPIWAAPGEFMVRRNSVSRYGSDVLEAINRGAVDPYALKAIAGKAARGGTKRMRRGMGFAEGGSIPRTNSATGPTILPVLVANDSQVEQLTKGGRAGMLRTLSRNRAETAAALGLTQ